MKTKLSIAISAALLSSAAIAGTTAQYNTTNQTTDKYAGISVSKNGNNEQKQAVAWMIKLKSPSLAQQSQQKGFNQQSVMSNIESSQANVRNAIQSMDADIKIVATTSKLVNSIVVQGDRKKFVSLLKNPEVADILPIYDYKLDVADSAEYIKAKAVIEAGVASGKGQKVAVLDTGVDYTHKALGGSGLVADYQAAVAAKSEQPNWPQGKIIGGWDFINNDPNPIDAGTNHGTHVSHSVVGVAPDIELLVYSVCTNLSCPGIAQLNALEASMDPNGDGDISDRVDTVNMSLGGDFGDTDGGAVQVMIDEMVQLGVNLVISAGNDGPTPFVVGGPSTTNSALSVGAMTHPTTKVGKVEALIAGNSVTAVAAGFNKSNVYSFTNTTAPIVYPAANKNGCAAYSEDLTGKTVLIDRGVCGFVVKVLNAQLKGASFVIVANNAAGAGAIVMGGTDDNITIPSVMVSKEDGDVIKTALAAGDVPFSISSTEVTTAGAIATFTSRGPSIAGTLKPEITAPGTDILTAHPGYGDKLSPISGTSFSSPITAGAVSIIREALPHRNAFEVKATIMNAANLDITLEPKEINPDTELAPISYIGSGLVDVEKAINLPVAAWNKETNQAALAFGLLALNKTTTMTKTVTVKNFSTAEKTYTLKVDQRFQNDLDSGALSFALPTSVTIPAGQTIDFDVTATIDPTKLPEWSLTSSYELDGTAADASTALTLSEYDGAIQFMDGEEKALHLVYHILPKAAAAISVSTEATEAGLVRTLTNIGATSITDPFTAPLIATSPVDASKRHDLLNASSELLLSSSCDAGIAIYNTLQMRDPIVHALTASYNVDYDLNNDGVWDYTAATVNLNWFDDAYPRSIYGLVSPYGTSDGFLEPVFHVTGNDFLTSKVCFEDVGLTETDLGKTIKVRYRVEDSDWAPTPSGDEDSTVATLVLDASGTSAMLVDSDGKEVTELKPGASALLEAEVGDDVKGFMFLSDSGSMSVVANTTDEGNSAPTVADTTLTVDKGTAAGTVLGQITATDPDMLTSPFSEFVTLSSNSSMVLVAKDGTVRLSDDAVINQQSGTIELEVAAIDTMGNTSTPAKITVLINNTKPTVAPTGMTSTEGFVVTAQANGKDADKDVLTYNWVQTGGTKVAFTNGGNAISFAAPSGDHVLTFSVTASDGKLESDAGTATITVNAKEAESSGGALGWLTALLLPLAAMRRRMK
ncbi:S8 family serine peptidase [Shewanella putrefaciens]|uniref:S8 family serine peptidase n=1 Tax=Shewanella putrefaciens TaxID=24 RepID=UPI0018E7D2D4|nr:S8 family serine peptidase [Shewanella putrefaciens]